MAVTNMVLMIEEFLIFDPTVMVDNFMSPENEDSEHCIDNV
jgi:hypothetical protein